MKFVFLTVAVLLSACAPIEHQAVITQSTGVQLVAGPGDVVAHVTKQRNLENIAGRADIWGRKTNEGYSELHFAGLSPAGEAVFYRNDITIVSNETTMSRSPFISSYGIARTSTTGTINAFGPSATYSGNSSTTASTVTVHPTSDYHAVIPNGSIPIVLPKGAHELIFEGYKVQIVDVSSGSLTYSLVKP